MNLEKSAASGLRWIGVSSGFGAILSFARLAVLAHLLTPREFGLMGLVNVVLGYAQAYAQMGISNAIIQKQTREPDQLSTLFWLTTGVSTTLAVGVVASRSLVAASMREPILADLLMVAAVVLPLNSVADQPVALLRRDLAFRTVAMLEMGAAALAFLVAVILALAGFGIWSLVHATVVGAAVRAISAFVAAQRRWPVRMHFDLAPVRQHLHFGAYQLAQTTMGYVATHLDALLIGRVVGVEALGAYNLALNFSRLPRQHLNPVLTKVMFPVFSAKSGEPSVVAGGLLRIQTGLAYLNFPIMIGASLLAPSIVEVLFGPAWSQAVPLMQILAFVALMQGTAGPVADVRLAMGHVRFNFYLTVVVSVVTVGALWFSVDHGVIALTQARLAVGLLFFPVAIGFTYHFVKTSPVVFLVAMIRPLVAVALMAGAVLGSQALFADASHVSRLVVGVGVGAVVYIGTALLLDRDFLLRHVALIIGNKR